MVETSDYLKEGAWLKPVRVAKILGVSTSTLRQWRFRNQGLKGVRLVGKNGSGSYRYHEQDVIDFIKQQREIAS